MNGFRRARLFEEVAMRNLIKSAAATVLSAMVATSVAPNPAAAGVVGSGEQAAVATASSVQQVYYRYYRHYYRPYHVHRHYYRHYYGYNPYYYNPAAAAVEAAGTVATFPFSGF
jgi:hypothetical protein